MQNLKSNNYDRNPTCATAKGHQTLAISRRYWCYMQRELYVKKVGVLQGWTLLCSL